MAVVAESSVVGENIKLRRPRSHLSPPVSESDPNPPQIPSIIQSTRSKSTISSILLSTFSNNATSGANESLSPPIITSRKKNFSSGTFRGFGCAASASQQVSVPAVIRTSADWQKNKTKKKKQKNSKNKTHQGLVDGSHFHPNSNFNSASCLDAQDVWCGPGIGFSTDAAPSVDCVVARRNVSGRGKIDLEKTSQRERSCVGRRTVNSEALLFLDSDSDLPAARSSEMFRGRYFRHVRHPSLESLAENMMFQSSLLMGGRFDIHDQFRELRLDVDRMSYEELLELGERIGYVSTGLKEDEIGRCIRKIKPFVVKELPSHFLSQFDRKCSICQEDYEADDEMGKLECGHSYHIQCIKQWLSQKNTCPVCKAAAAGRG